MKIGVVRHFRIPHSQVRMVDGPGFDQWAPWYDTIDVKAMDVPFTSFSPRKPMPPLIVWQATSRPIWGAIYQFES